MSKLTGFIGPTYTVQTVNADCQRTINLYAQVDEYGTGKEGEVAILLSVPGFDIAHVIPRTPIRGIHRTSNEHVYIAAGNGLYQAIWLAGTWSHKLFAFLDTTTGPVSFADGTPNQLNGKSNVDLPETGLATNKHYVVCVDGSANGRAWDDSTQEAVVLSAGNGFFGANYITFQDGLFIGNAPGTATAFFTADPLIWDPLNIVVANIGADIILRVISDHDLLWFFGQRSSTVWQNAGGTFISIQGSLSEAGCPWPGTIQKIDGSLVWLSSDDRGKGMIFRSNGYRGSRISNHAVEDWLQSFETLDGATSWTYQDRGHAFYTINVPTSKTSWTLDLTTSLWSERAFFKDGQYSRDLVEFHVNSLHGHLCGSYNSSKIFTLNNDTYDHLGYPIRRMRTAPHISSAFKRVYHNQILIDIESGTGQSGGLEGFKMLAGPGPTVIPDPPLDKFIIVSIDKPLEEGNDSLHHFILGI